MRLGEAMNGWICDNCRHSSLDVHPHERGVANRVPEGWISAPFGDDGGWVACSVKCAEQLRPKKLETLQDAVDKVFVEELMTARDDARKENEQLRARVLELQREMGELYMSRDKVLRERNQLLDERNELRDENDKLLRECTRRPVRRDVEGKITRQHSLKLDVCPRCQKGRMEPWGMWALRCDQCECVVTVNPGRTP